MDDRLLVGSTWTCPDLDLLTALETLERAGFTEVEVWAEGFHLDPRVKPAVDGLVTWLDAHSLAVRSVHLPFDAILPGESADDRAQEWQRLCTETLDLAQTLGASLAVAHPVLFIDGADQGDQGDRVLDRLVHVVQALGDHAQTRGIQLALENMHTLRGPTLQSVGELRTALGQLTCPVGICLDIGHAVFNGYTGGGLIAEIAGAGELLVNTHIHDSDGVGRDPHLVPGDGLVDWPATFDAFQAAGYRGGHVLEIRGGSDPYATLLRARERLLS